jgi:shikimate kinase
MNLYLIGFRCSGKSTIGRFLSNQLHLPFIDTDSVIMETCGSTIREWVAAHGWDSFRRLESDVMRDLSARSHQVVATGGGIVLYEQNIVAMKDAGSVVWLRIRPETAASRMARDPNSGMLRPGLSGNDPMIEIADLLRQRTPLYQKASDLTIDCDDSRPEQIADIILSWIQEIRLWPEIRLEQCFASPPGENPMALPSGS